MIVTIDLGELGPQDCEATGTIDDSSIEDLRIAFRGVDITDDLKSATLYDIASQMIESRLESIADSQLEQERSA